MRLFAIVLLFLLSGPATAGIYKCQDARGHISYSDKRCAAGQTLVGRNPDGGFVNTRPEGDSLHWIRVRGEAQGTPATASDSQPVAPPAARASSQQSPVASQVVEGEAPASSAPQTEPR